MPADPPTDQHHRQGHCGPCPVSGLVNDLRSRVASLEAGRLTTDSAVSAILANIQAVKESMEALNHRLDTKDSQDSADRLERQKSGLMSNPIVVNVISSVATAITLAIVVGLFWAVSSSGAVPVKGNARTYQDPSDQDQEYTPPRRTR